MQRFYSAYPNFFIGQIRVQHKAMISVLAQERLLGFALGTAFTGVIVFDQRKRIHRSIAETQSQFAPQSQLQKPIFEKEPGLDFAHLWNKVVDQTFQPVIRSLSSRGW